MKFGTETSVDGGQPLMGDYLWHEEPILVSILKVFWKFSGKMDHPVEWLSHTNNNISNGHMYSRNWYSLRPIMLIVASSWKQLERVLLLISQIFRSHSQILVQTNQLLVDHCPESPTHTLTQVWHKTFLSTFSQPPTHPVLPGLAEC